MVSSLSSRLLAGRGDCASRASSKDHGSPQHKRTIGGSIKTRKGFNNDKNESTVSGYSADREGPSSYPPVVSINLHSKSRSSTLVDALRCPKRRKKNEMQFTATTVKADLARAGKDFKPVKKDLERSTILGDMNIKINDHVRLVHSNEISESLTPPSKIGKKTTITDYTALINAVSAFYPCKSTQMSDMKSFEPTPPAGQNAWSEPSTSSVSDTLSDSGSDNTNNQAATISPLLEDSLDTNRKHSMTRQKISKAVIKKPNAVSSVSSGVTLTKIFQLSKTARVVVNSFSPFSIVHANAAFHRLSGKKASDKVIGKSFFSLLDPEANPSEDEMSLSSFMISSSRGDDPKLYLSPRMSSGSASDKKLEPVKCTIRVSPVLGQKIQIEDHAQVEYFVIELVSDGKEFDETCLTKKSHSSFPNPNTPMGVVA